MDTKHDLAVYAGYVNLRCQSLYDRKAEKILLSILSQKNKQVIRRVLIGMFFETLPSRAENDVFHCVECDVPVGVMFAGGE